SSFQPALLKRIEQVPLCYPECRCKPNEGYASVRFKSILLMGKRLVLWTLTVVLLGAGGIALLVLYISLAADRAATIVIINISDSTIMVNVYDYATAKIPRTNSALIPWATDLIINKEVDSPPSEYHLAPPDIKFSTRRDFYLQLESSGELFLLSGPSQEPVT